MKLIVLFLIVSFLQTAVNAQNTVANSKSIIYLVRHAEKEKGDDPGLTTAGKQRAGDLLRVLKNKKLQRIYVTQFRRTQMTGDSLRIQLAIDTVQYTADTTGADLLEKIKIHHDSGKTILIIGHTNTLPIIVKKLGVQQPLKDIPDNEFDNLFMVKYRKGKAQLIKSKYGARRAKAASTATMQPLQ